MYSAVKTDRTVLAIKKAEHGTLIITLMEAHGEIQAMECLLMKCNIKMVLADVCDIIKL